MTTSPLNPSSKIISLSGLTIDLLAHTVKHGEQTIDLTRLEFKLLVCIAQNVDRVFSKEDLLAQVWKCSLEDGGTAAQVENRIKRLRAKLGEWGQKHIITIHGVGYKIQLGDG